MHTQCHAYTHTYMHMHTQVYTHTCAHTHVQIPVLIRCWLKPVIYSVLYTVYTIESFFVVYTILYMHTRAVLDFQLSESSYNVNEGDGFARVCVDLIAGIPQRTIPITLATTPGSATGNYCGIYIVIVYNYIDMYIHVSLYMHA